MPSALVDPELLEILRCPKCLGAVTEHHGDNANGLACSACKLLYRVDDGLPNFLVDEAVPLHGAV